MGEQRLDRRRDPALLVVRRDGDEHLGRRRTGPLGDQRRRTVERWLV
jgi:hypothetical protein